MQGARGKGQEAAVGWTGVVSPEDSGASRAGQRCSMGGRGGLSSWGERASGGGGELGAGGDSEREKRDWGGGTGRGPYPE